MAVSRTAASATVRVIGPAVSCVWEIGMMPVRETRPTVGLKPTSAQLLDGDTIEPSVSVPIVRAQRLAAAAVPEPELEPEGSRSRAYGLTTCPPRPLHPLCECVERKFAHSERLVLPRMTAPASRRRFTMAASAAGIAPTRASDP